MAVTEGSSCQTIPIFVNFTMENELNDVFAEASYIFASFQYLKRYKVIGRFGRSSVVSMFRSVIETNLARE